MIAQIEFTQWTPDSQLRHSKFCGFREDKTRVTLSARNETETITGKPSYRRLAESKRCLIPADGFYEWR
jgi:putative SOS response-associated peptidase YedK